MKCRISRDLLDRIAGETRASPSHEACGLLLGMAGEITQVVPLPNVARDPRISFMLEPRGHLWVSRRARAAGLAILGHFHSHPTGRARPSASDAALAGEQGLLWMIVAGDEQRLWVSRRGGRVAGAFEPVRLQVLDALPCQQGAHAPIEVGAMQV
jgi:proteasome lid subunit RPN8/RPN11